MIITQSFSETILINLMWENVWTAHGLKGIYGQSVESGQDNLGFCAVRMGGAGYQQTTDGGCECFAKMCPTKALHDSSASASSAAGGWGSFPDVSKNGSGAEQKLLKGYSISFGGGGAGCGGGPGRRPI